MKEKRKEKIEGKRSFQRFWNYTPAKGAVNTLPSETMPGQSDSIPELLRKYAQGVYLTPNPGFYDSDEDWSDFDDMDSFDLMQLAKDNSEKIKYLQDEIGKQQTAEQSHEVQAEKEASANPAPAGTKKPLQDAQNESE